MYKLNSEYYRFEEINYNKGILDSCIDATYVLHLENNGRIDKVLSQLDRVHISKQIYIMYNAGFKKTDKMLPKYTTAFDLIDGCLQIFTHANNNNYNNILILEDDFIFDHKIFNPCISDRIKDFIDNQTDKVFSYALGCIPYILCPVSLYTLKVYSGAAAHAVIYTKNFRKKILSSNTNNIIDWDVEIHKYNFYCYYKPICYQLFLGSENLLNFYNNNKFIVNKILIPLFKLIQIDKSYEPQYSIIYITSFILTCLLIFLILKLILYLSKKIKYLQ